MPPASLTAESLAAQARQKPEDDLAAIESQLLAALGDAPGRPPRLTEAMRYAVLGPGKRLRPRLVLLSARACGGEVGTALGAAAAVELIHAYSLVHDDLPAMDDDDLRRGRPTCHRQFDEATAILVGDALLALAFEQLATHTQPPQVAARCCAELARAAGPGGLVGGQADDLAGVDGAEQSGADPRAWLEAIHARKTGALITVSLRLGAITAGADQARLDAVTAFGHALGLAFQVTDDLLDAQGEAERVGKRTGKDQERGKLTYPGLMGVDASRDYAGELIQRACQALAPLGATAAPLRALAEQVADRSH